MKKRIIDIVKEKQEQENPEYVFMQVKVEKTLAEKVKAILARENMSQQEVLHAGLELFVEENREQVKKTK
jgi:hypothetical protein